MVISPSDPHPHHQREQEGDKRSALDPPKTCLFYFLNELPPCITTLMKRKFVKLTPEKVMLGNGYDNPSTTFRRLKHLKKNFFIFLDMFQQIKGTNNIKLLFKRNPSGIHLKKSNSSYAFACI